MTLDAQSIGDAGMYKFGKTVVLKVTVFFLTSIQTFIQVMASFSLVALSTHDCCKRFFLIILYLLLDEEQYLPLKKLDQ